MTNTIKFEGLEVGWIAERLAPRLQQLCEESFNYWSDPAQAEKAAFIREASAARQWRQRASEVDFLVEWLEQNLAEALQG